MRIIDFHVHVFADKIAKKATKRTSDYYLTPSEDENGTLDSLLKSIEGYPIEKMVVHSTATKEEQVVSINDFLSSLKDERFIKFGTIHQNFGDVGGEVKRMKELGLKGIKLHPDFQGFEADSKMAYPIYESAQEENLPILLHVGDAVSDLSHPKRIRKIAKDFKDLTIVAAHLGGREVWDEGVEELSDLQNVYVDTSSSINRLGARKATDIIKKFGVERTLFATDYPMATIGNELKRFMYLLLSDDEKEQILYKNAQRLLKL